MTSVAFALLHPSRRRSVFSSQRAARGGEHHEHGEAGRRYALTLELERQALPHRGLRPQQRLERAMSERVA